MTTESKVPPTLSLKPDITKGLGNIVETGMIDPRQLQVAETNCRTTDIPENERNAMDASLAHNGVAVSVVLNMEGRIVDGQLRWKAALRDNLTSIPYVKINFKDTFSERVYSMLQDEHHHKLEAIDKYIFIKKCAEIEKKSLQEIADALGNNIDAVRSWTHYQEVPDVVAKDENLKNKYLDLTGKRRIAVRSILEKPAYANDIEKSLEFIDFATEAPLRELHQARKDASSGSPIDAKARKKKLKERTTLIEIKIPKDLDRTFRACLKKDKKDYVIILEKLIRGYTRGLYDVDLIE